MLRGGLDTDIDETRLVSVMGILIRLKAVATQVVYSDSCMDYKSATMNG